MEIESITMDEDFMITAAEEQALLAALEAEQQEFMLVPELLTEETDIDLEQYLLEENFSGLTGTILRPNPSGAFVVDVDQSSSFYSIGGDNNNNNSGQNFAPAKHNAHLVQQQQQNQYYAYQNHENGVNTYQYQHQHQQQQQSGSGDFDYLAYPIQVARVESFDFSAPVVQQQPQSHVDNVQQQQQNAFPQYENVQIADSKTNWLTSDTDFVQAATDEFYDGVQQEIKDQNEILEEIIREAEEIASRRDSPAVLSTYSDMSESGGESPAAASYESGVDDDEEDSTSMDSFRSSAASDSTYAPSSSKSRVHAFELDHSFGQRVQRAGGRGGRSKRDADAGDLHKTKPVKRVVQKEKKRSQNREAALRYRLKKKAEKMATSGELGALEERNVALKRQKTSLAAEIAYLKGLLLEVRKLKSSNK